jgi:hypothetical protein
MIASLTSKRGVVSALGRYVVSIAGALLVIGLAPYLLFAKSEVGTALASAAIGVVAFLMVRLNEVAEFSLGPLKARMRESIAEANATVAQLREVALALGRSGLTTLGADQFMDGMSQSTRLAMHDQIIGALVSIGATPGDLNRATTEWRQCLAMRYHRIIVDTAQPTTVGEQQRAAKTKLESLAHYSTWEMATPQRYLEVLAEFGLLRPEVKEWVADYEHLLKTSTLQRRDEFIGSN